MLGCGLAFTIWTFALVLHQGDLGAWVVAGILVGFIGVLFFVVSNTIHWENRSLAQLFLWLIVIFDVVIFVVRFIYPSQPYISDQGLFFFNPNPYVGFMDLVFLSVAIIPASLSTAKEIMNENHTAAIMLEVSMVTILIGVVLLITNYNTVILNLTGWVMGFAFLGLLYSAVSLKSLKN